MSEVLVIEDDGALAHLFELILRRDGVNAEVIQRGDDGADAIARNGDQYDAIILDVMMPGIDGIEILDRVKKNTPHLLDRILVISAASAGVLQKISATSAVRGVFRKPFDLDTVLLTLRECLRDHAALNH